jgi:hypothetical protein
MIGLSISFGDDGPKFNFGECVRDFDATVQNALVNVGTRRGSDPLFTDRGTDLVLDAARGRMINLTWANQVSNFAALKTLAFMQSVDTESSSSKLQDFKLQSVALNDQRVDLLVQAVSNSGEVRGSVVTI